MKEKKDFFTNIIKFKEDYNAFVSSFLDVKNRKPLLNYMAKKRSYVKSMCENEKEFSAVWDYINNGCEYWEMYTYAQIWRYWR